MGLWNLKLSVTELPEFNQVLFTFGALSQLIVCDKTRYYSMVKRLK